MAQGTALTYSRNSVVTGPKEWGNIAASLEYVQKASIHRQSRLLDVGCYTGSLVYNLHLAGFERVCGVDIDKKSIAKGKALYPDISDKLHNYDGATLPYENSRFDIVTMFDVIEHIESVQGFLSGEIRRVLKSGGVLMFQTPNKFTNIPWEILIHKSFSFYKKYHVSLQSYKSLSLLLEKSGFVDIDIEKCDLRTTYYLEALKNYIGPLAYPTLLIANTLPVRWSPNFWGYCRSMDI